MWYKRRVIHSPCLAWCWTPGVQEPLETEAQPTDGSSQLLNEMETSPVSGCTLPGGVWMPDQLPAPPYPWASHRQPSQCWDITNSAVLEFGNPAAHCKDCTDLIHLKCQQWTENAPFPSQVHTQLKAQMMPPTAQKQQKNTGWAYNQAGEVASRTQKRATVPPAQKNFPNA